MDLAPPGQDLDASGELYAGLLESRFCRKLTHANIITVIDQFHDPASQTLFLILPLMSGGNLSERLDGWRSRAACDVKESDVLKWLQQLAKACTYLAKKCIVHADIKGLNCLLQSSSNTCVLKLSDFGTTTQLDGPNSTRKGVVGTVPFMAPELREDREWGLAVDVFAFGVVVFESLTGFPTGYEGVGELIYDQERTNILPNEDALALIEMCTQPCEMLRWTWKAILASPFFSPLAAATVTDVAATIAAKGWVLPNSDLVLAPAQSVEDFAQLIDDCAESASRAYLHRRQKPSQYPDEWKDPADVMTDGRLEQFARVPGLINRGNICHVNAVLAALRLVLSPNTVWVRQPAQPFAAHFFRFMDRMLPVKPPTSLRFPVLDPGPLMVSLAKERGDDRAKEVLLTNRQQDAAETLDMVLSALTDVCSTKGLPTHGSDTFLGIRAAAYHKQLKKAGYAPMVDTAITTTARESRCQEEDHTLVTLDHEMSLKVAMPGDGEGKLNVSSLLCRHFLVTGGDGAHRCADCGLPILSSRVCLLKLPSMLVIQLKRFSVADGENPTVVKDGRAVEVDEELRYGQYSAALHRSSREHKTQSTFKLVAAIVHEGTAAGGHYVTYGRVTGRDHPPFFIRFSDTQVHAVCKAPLDQAYVLFYEKSL